MRTITPIVRSFLTKRYDIKIFYLLIVFFTWSNTMFAQQRSEAEAMAIAEQFLSSKGNSPSSQLKMVSRSAIDRQIRHHAHAKNPPAASAFYIVNDEASNRFVVVSSDVRLHEVLGYSEKGTIIPDSMPCGMAAMLESYNKEYAYVLEHGITTKAQQAPRKIKAVSPLIKSDWGQSVEEIDGNYYWLFNTDCPETENGYCATGCIATAMAQIMNYHKYPSRGQGTKSYTSSNTDENLTYNLSINFADKAFDWSNMLNTYKNGITKMEQLYAVAYLMKACGYSVNMVYGDKTGSGAESCNVPYAMINYFKYNPNMVYYMGEYYSSEEWEEIIQTELNAKRPILYSAIDPDYNGEVAGHAFILDGCNSNGYYHFNWGWNGYYDNYFLLSALNPIDMNYSVFHDMVCRISPQTVGTHEDIFYTDKFEIEGWKNDYTIGQSAAVILPGLTICCTTDANTYDTKFTGYIAFIVLNSDEDIIMRGGGKVEPNCFGVYEGITLGKLTFSSDLFKEDSKYKIIPVVYNSSLSSTTPIRTLGGETDYYTAVVKNGKVKIYLKDDVPEPPTPIPVNKITLNQTSASLTAGGTLQLKATVLPENATDKTITWTTSNKSVATVDNNGKVTAVAAGTATITCTANDGSGVKATCTVTVKPNIILVNKITLSQTSATLTAGETLQLTETVLPENATDKSVTWTSSNTSVATVDSNGKVTAVGAGTATITCTANDGSGVTASCDVTINTPDMDLYWISVTCQNSNPLQLTPQDELKLTATLGNNGGAGNTNIRPAIFIMKNGKLSYTKKGEEKEHSFAASPQNTIIESSLSLADIPAGDYYATVQYYKNSQWWYNKDCLVEIKIQNSDACDITDISKLDNAIYMKSFTALSGSNITIPISLKNKDDISGYQFALELPNGVEIATNERGKYLAQLINERHDEHTLSVNYKDGIYYFGVLSLSSNGGNLLGNDGDVIELTLQIPDNLEEGYYPISISNAKYSKPNGESIKVDDTKSCMSIENYIKGDVNNDQEIDIADAVCIVNYVVRKTNKVFIEKAADVNGDGDIDIADAVSIVNIVVRKTTL